jgi:hypothetical protein
MLMLISFLNDRCLRPASITTPVSRAGSESQYRNNETLLGNAR